MVTTEATSTPLKGHLSHFPTLRMILAFVILVANGFPDDERDDHDAHESLTQKFEAFLAKSTFQCPSTNEEKAHLRATFHEAQLTFTNHHIVGTWKVLAQLGK